MKSVPAFRPRLLATSLAFAFLAPWAHAATFEGQISTDGLAVESAPPAGAVYGYSSTAASGSSSFAGDAATGESRVSATSSGAPLATLVDTTLVFRQTVVNPYATAQQVGFEFHIPRSRAYLTLGSGTSIQSFSAIASFIGDISWGGQTAWSIAYGIEGSGSVGQGGGTLVKSGPTLSSSASGFTVLDLQGSIYLSSDTIDDVEVFGLSGDGTVMSDSYTGYLDLGVIGPNQSVELSYTLAGSASFEATYRDNSSAGAYGYGGYAQAGGFDPFGIDFSPDPTDGGIQIVFTQAVPEPGTYALMAIGLLGVAGAARRRQRATACTGPDTGGRPQARPALDACPGPAAPPTA